MERVCPNPIPWREAFKRLAEFANGYCCTPGQPPKPLILGAWGSTNDVEKMERWRETVAWAKSNGCSALLAPIPDHDFYWVNQLSSAAIGPLGGPCYRPWDFTRRTRPAPADADKYLDYLSTHWAEIVGTDLARVTRPGAFSGRKMRRLVVSADPEATPPWGEWRHRSEVASKRNAFTEFRAAINAAIAPHEVDHISFVHQEPQRQERGAGYVPDSVSGEPSALFGISPGNLKRLSGFVRRIRGNLTRAEPDLIRESALAILALERLPHPTPGVCVELGYSQVERGERSEAVLTLTQNRLEATIVKVAPDADGRTVYSARVNGVEDGDLKRWLYFADQFACGGQFYVSDQSGAFDWSSYATGRFKEIDE